MPGREQELLEQEEKGKPEKVRLVQLHWQQV